MIRAQDEALLTRKGVDILEVPDAARAVARFQVAIELRIAGARIVATITEWAIDAQHRGCGQDRSQSAEERAHSGPTHDVQSVGCKESVDGLELPGQLTDVELQGRQEIWSALVRDPLAQACQVFARITRLPDEMREMRGEVNGMLTRSTADFEYLATVSESLRKNFAYGFFVTLAGFGYTVRHCRVKTRRARVATASTKSLS